MVFVERCYRATSDFPRGELYGLTSQLRRAATSIPSNIAEGYCRRNTRVYVNHVAIALGSHGEVETLIDLSCRLGFISETRRNALEKSSTDVGRLLTALHRSLEERVRQEDQPRVPSP